MFFAISSKWKADSISEVGIHIGVPFFRMIRLTKVVSFFSLVLHHEHHPHAHTHTQNGVWCKSVRLFHLLLMQSNKNET